MKKMLKTTLLVAAVLSLGIFVGSTMAAPAAGGFNANTAGNAGADFGLAGGTAGNTSITLLTVVKSFINWVLGLLSLIALAMALYGGFKMVTAAGEEENYKAGFKILKQAAIGLVIVGFSWIIVSSIFWIIGGFSNGSAPVTQ